jgi:hypothetical protein
MPRRTGLPWRGGLAIRASVGRPGDHGRVRADTPCGRSRPDLPPRRDLLAQHPVCADNTQARPQLPALYRSKASRRTRTSHAWTRPARKTPSAGDSLLGVTGLEEAATSEEPVPPVLSTETRTSGTCCAMTVVTLRPRRSGQRTHHVLSGSAKESRQRSGRGRGTRGARPAYVDVDRGAHLDRCAAGRILAYH